MSLLLLMFLAGLAWGALASYWLLLYGITRSYVPLETAQALFNALARAYPEMSYPLRGPALKGGGRRR